MIKLTQEARPDKDKPLRKPDTLGLVPAWSYSTLKTFEECPYRTYISKVRKIREPSGPAAERGSKIHQEAGLIDKNQSSNSNIPFIPNFEELIYE